MRLAKEPGQIAFCPVHGHNESKMKNNFDPIIKPTKLPSIVKDEERLNQVTSGSSTPFSIEASHSKSGPQQVLESFQQNTATPPGPKPGRVTASHSSLDTSREMLMRRYNEKRKEKSGWRTVLFTIGWLSVLALIGGSFGQIEDSVNESTNNVVSTFESAQAIESGDFNLTTFQNECLRVEVPDIWQLKDEDSVGGCEINSSLAGYTITDTVFGPYSDGSYLYDSAEDYFSTVASDRSVREIGAVSGGGTLYELTSVIDESTSYTNYYVWMRDANVRTNEDDAVRGMWFYFYSSGFNVDTYDLSDFFESLSIQPNPSTSN